MRTQERILYIINKLLQQECCSKHLAQEVFGQMGSSEIRKIQNDIKLLKETFKENLVSTKRGCYKLINLSKSLENLYSASPDELHNIFEFVALFDAKILTLFEMNEPSLVRKIKKDIESIYHIHEAPFEEIQNHEIWNTVKKAVKERRYLSIAYQKHNMIAYNYIKPIKIVFASNNWYLASIVTEIDKFEYQFTFFRINHIVAATLESKSFQEDVEAKQHLKEFQSLFDHYGVQKYLVRLHVDREVAPYFRQKKYLKSQKIEQTNSDGSLVLSYQVTNSMEILPLIKRWLPHLHVLEPVELKSEIRAIFEDYLNKKI